MFLFIFLKLLLDFIFNQSVVDLQCSIRFKSTAKWYSYTNTHTHTHTHTYSSQIIFPYGLLQNIEYNFLCYLASPLITISNSIGEHLGCFQLLPIK